MAWGSKTQMSTTESVSGTAKQDPSAPVTLNPGESAHVQVEADFPATPTDNLLIYIEPTLDDSSENWDDTGYGAPITIGNGVDPNALSFIVTNVYKFRLRYAVSGSTDTITVNAWYRKDGVSL